MRYRALAVDLDGTLLHSDDRVTERSLRALRAAEAADLRIIIATARWYQLAQRVNRPLEKLDAAVLRILRISGYQLLFQSRLPAAAVINAAFG